VRTPVAFLLLLLQHVAASPPLFAALSAPFMHSGVVHAADRFEYYGVTCGYLEPENVTVAPAVGIGWTEGGSCGHLFSCPAGGCAGPCKPQPPHSGFDRQGGDYRSFSPGTPSPDGSVCEAACCAEAQCVAWVYAPEAPAGQPVCLAGQPCCYLKASAPAETPGAGLINGLVGHSFSGVPPPIGMRSAVPLGGIGAGALELRADGTVHEVTIQNQSPAGAAKYGVLADMMLGARVGGVARALRTQPPSFATGVTSLAYSGLYPLSRLAVADGDFGADVAVAAFAYSKLVPGDPVASSAPAIAFTLAVANAGASAVAASFFLSLPLGAVNDCARISSVPLLSNITTADYATCLAACSTTAGCASWTWNGSCWLASDVPLSTHRDGAYCGVRGVWSAAADGAALTLDMPCAATGTPSPACGDATLRSVLVAAGQPGVATGSVGVAADPATLWASFAATGALPAGAIVDERAAHGAAALTVEVPAGANVTLSIVLSWYFPFRDHFGESIGNFYAGNWAGSDDVAQSFSRVGALEGIATDLAAHHAVFAGGASSLPEYLADTLINQMSHFRGMIWSRDGRMREFEAYDCIDVDSIHNDAQRHLPYLWLLPEYPTQLLRKWASGQMPEGYIQEFLGPFGAGPFDVPGGRIMGDTTSMWVIGLFEMWRHTGDDALLTELYPVVQGALSWMMNNSAPLGLPEKLYSTYDILWLESYNTTAYNAFLYMSALSAGAALADRVGDAVTAATVATALTRAQAATQTLLWTGSYFRAYSYNGDAAVMADALYGQVVARAAGLPFFAPQEQLASHLRAELAFNYDTNGFRVVTGRVTPPPDGQDPDDKTLWMQAGPDWSAMALQLDPATSPTGSSVTAALDPARRQLENWRSRLHNLWNIAGLTTLSSNVSDSDPSDTSAYPYVTCE